MEHKLVFFLCELVCVSASYTDTRGEDLGSDTGGAACDVAPAPLPFQGTSNRRHCAAVWFLPAAGLLQGPARCSSANNGASPPSAARCVALCCFVPACASALVKLGTHSQRRSHQRRAAPLCCGISPLGLYRGCCCIAPTTLGVVGVTQKQPNADPMGQCNSTT